MPDNELNDLRAAITFRNAERKAEGIGSIMTPDGPISIRSESRYSESRSFTLRDYKWSEDYEINGNTPLVDYDAVPKLILVEKQPKKKVDWSKILSDMTALGDLPLIQAVTRFATTGAQTGSQVAGSAYLNNLAAQFSSSVDESSKLLDISSIEGLIEGDVLGTYEIPFYNNTYLRSDTKDGWSIGNALDSAGRMGELLNDGFNMNIIKSPQWSNNNTEGMGWETEFHLLNDDLEALRKNFMFINSLFPGTQWVHIPGNGNLSEQVEKAHNAVGSFVETHAQGSSIGNLSLAYAKSPNIFKVECPGRFLQLFVAIDMTVEFVGNVRKMPLHTKLDMPMLNKDTLYPDAYKITLSARDLTPSCFNVYANYLAGNQKVRVSSGADSEAFVASQTQGQ